MKIVFAELGVAGVAELAQGIFGIGGSSSSMEEAAERIAELFHERLLEPDGRPSCILARLFKTHRIAELEPGLRDALRAGPQGPSSAAEGARCLTLLGTRGAEPAWNDRRLSRDHRAIPLLDVDAVQRLPMVARLIRDLGLETSQVIAPEPDLVVRLSEQTCNVFFVRDALGSPHIPEQATFVSPYGVRSVLGFGGVLPSGDLFAAILFTRTRLEPAVAELFKILAVSVKGALVPFDRGPIFRSELERTSRKTGRGEPSDSAAREETPDC